MGGRSSSSSSSQQTTTTQQTDRRIGATDHAVVIAPESNSPITIDTTDPALLQLAGGVIEEAASFARAAFDDALLSVQQSSDKAIAASREGSVGARDLLIWGSVAAVAYGLMKGS